MKKETKMKIARAIDTTARVLYFPVYTIGWALSKVCRLALAFTYAMMLDVPAALITLRSVFSHGKE